MVAPTGSVKIQFFFSYVYGKTIFLILVLLSFYPLRYVLVFVPKSEQEKGKPVLISFLSNKPCFSGARGEES